MPFTIEPIGFVRGGRTDPIDDNWGSSRAMIVLDAINGTPVIDIKPVMRAFLPRGPVRQPEWVSELMAAYW